MWLLYQIAMIGFTGQNFAHIEHVVVQKYFKDCV